MRAIRSFIDEVLNKIMDLFIPSLIMTVGLATIIGFFYSILLSFKYSDKNKFFSKKQIILSFIMEVIFVLFLFIIYLNVSLFSSYNPIIKLLMFSLNLLFSIIISGFIFSLLWILSKKIADDFTVKEILIESFHLISLGIPLWLVYFPFLILSIILVVVKPWLLIIMLGANFLIIDKVFTHTNRKFRLGY